MMDRIKTLGQENERVLAEKDAVIRENEKISSGAQFSAIGNLQSRNRQPKEMESINKELVEVTTQQLSARKEEMKQQQAHIEQLETELAQMNLELEQFQDKHDKIVHGKTESLDKQQAVLDEKLMELMECQQALQASEREKAKWKGIVCQLRAQLDSLKAESTNKELVTNRQLKKMESINKELVASCEVATQQLSARKEEMKQQLVRIEQLETELAQVNLELEQFQDKHDKMMHVKTESLDKQQAVLDEKLKELVECQQALQASEREKGKLERIVRQLRAQLDSLKTVAGSNERNCPVCNTKFPGHMSQHNFECHVQGHFGVHKEEMKQQLVRIEPLETELAQVNLELEQCQDKHDKMIHAKTESLDKLQVVLSEKLKELVECQQALQASEKEKGKLEGIVRQLRAQLDSLKAVAGSNERTCPVCNTKFPGNMSQHNFENHVQGHF
jgi:DNA repair exonuclease SbcCD ATPase subunit